MSRVRDESKWKFRHYSDTKDFLSNRIESGAHSIPYKGLNLDLFVEDRKSPVTIIVFHSAVPDSVKTYPVFAGEKMTADVGVNLISVSDPSLAIPGVFLGWHLGNSITGPLKEIWRELITHILEDLRSEREILFGASGGAFAAANIATDFPSSIAFLVNPRVSLHRMSKVHLSNYFELCHGWKPISTVTQAHLEFMSQFGITDLKQSVSARMNHHVAIYQNLGDARFLTQQVLPLMAEIGNHPQVHLRLSSDKPGHSSIPGATLREILRSLASHDDVPDALNDAGFAEFYTSLTKGIEGYPSLIEEVSLREAEVRDLKASLAQQKTTLEAKIVGAINRDKRTKEQLTKSERKIESLERQLKLTRQELAVFKSQPTFIKM